MPARSQGQVIERVWRRGRGYALRFLAYDERQYVTLGLETDGWTRKRAEQELQNVLADVRRGLWTPPDRNRKKRVGSGPQAPEACPLFGAFALELLAARKAEVQSSTHEYFEWTLSHLLP